MHVCSSFHVQTIVKNMDHKSRLLCLLILWSNSKFVVECLFLLLFILLVFQIDEDDIEDMGEKK